MGLSGAPAAGPLAPGQRWSVARKRAVVLRLIAGEPVELVSREIGVPVFKFERWRERLRRRAAAARPLRGPAPADAERPLGSGPINVLQWSCSHQTGHPA
jgi:transposase-like protein